MKIKDVKIIIPDVHCDYRGDLWTLWKKGEHNLDFNHDKVSTSRKHVLRGIHGDKKSWKLITCLYGELYFVVVDNREYSYTYKVWDSLILNDRIRKQVLIPPGVGNGFHYKWSYEGDYPDVDQQFTIKWNDPDININWPINNPILQQRDK